MPEVNSRIRLEAVGADQTAREIRKLKGAYDDVAESAKEAQGAGVGGAGGRGPFQQAVTQGKVIDSKEVFRRREDKERDRRGIEARERPHRERQGDFFQTARAATATASSASQGPQGAVQGAQGIGGLFKAITANPVLLAAATAVGVGVYGAQREYTAMQQMYGGGVAQRMGMGYFNLRETDIKARGAGVTEANRMGMYQALGQAGFVGGPSVEMLELQQRTGVSADAFAQMMSVRQRAQRAGEDVTDGSKYLWGKYLLPTAKMFGAGKLSQVTGGLSQMMQRRMALGGTGGSFADLGARARELGARGLSATGALDVMQRVEQSISQGVGRPSSPLDTMIIRRFMEKKPGMSLVDAQVYLQTHPDEAQNIQDEVLEKFSPDVQARMLSRARGITISQAIADVPDGYAPVSKRAGAMFKDDALGPTPSGIKAGMELFGKLANALEWGGGSAIRELMKEGGPTEQLNKILESETPWLDLLKYIGFGKERVSIPEYVEESKEYQQGLNAPVQSYPSQGDSDETRNVEESKEYQRGLDAKVTDELEKHSTLNGRQLKELEEINESLKGMIQELT